LRGLSELVVVSIVMSLGHVATCTVVNHVLSAADWCRMPLVTNLLFVNKSAMQLVTGLLCLPLFSCPLPH